MDKVLANKALGRDKFFERESQALLPSRQRWKPKPRSAWAWNRRRCRGKRRWKSGYLRQNEAVRYFCQYWTYSDPWSAASVAKTINDSKAARRARRAMSRSCDGMAADYISLRTNTDADCISAYKHGQGVVAKKKKNAKKMIKKLSGATTVQLNELAKHMRVPHFRGIFIHNMLPTSDARRNESDIVNLDDVITDSTRPVTSSRTQRNNRVMYFDSFGNLRPPKKLVRYFENDVTTIKYKRMSFQTYDQNFCGQMCLRFL